MMLSGHMSSSESFVTVDVGVCRDVLALARIHVLSFKPLEELEASLSSQDSSFVHLCTCEISACAHGARLRANLGQCKL